MQKEKSIYADVLESAISWRVRDMYNLYGTIRRVLFEGRKAERAAMLSELIKMQGGNIGGSAKACPRGTTRRFNSSTFGGGAALETRRSNRRRRMELGLATA